MSLPKMLKVGGAYYDIEVTDEILLVDHQQCRGLIDYDRHKIKIASESLISEQRQWQTLFHELVHALRDSRNLDWDDKDELYTDELGIALHTFFVDNGLIQYLEGEEDAP